MNHRATQHPVLEFLNRHALKIPFIALAVAVAIAFYLDARNSAEDEKKRCEAGVDTRNVQRQTVEAIYGLATSAAQRDPNAPPLSRAEVKQYNAYIVRVNAFRENTYKLIKPSDICAPYVEDDDVRPPTPPVPPLKYKEQ